MNYYIFGASGFLAQSFINYKKTKYLKIFNYSRKKNRGNIYVKSYEQVDPLDNSVLIYFSQSNNNESCNLEKELLIFKKIISKNWKFIVFISSSLVYGDLLQTKRITTENVTPYNCYTSLKIKSEKLLSSKNSLILRLTNVYGKNMSNKSIIMDILKQINNDKIILNNNNSSRDYLYVKDFVDLLYKACMVKKPGIFNVGFGNNQIVDKLVSEILKIKGISYREISYRKKSNKMSMIKVDIEDTKKTFNWYPKYNIYHGLKEIIK